MPIPPDTFVSPLAHLSINVTHAAGYVTTGHPAYRNEFDHFIDWYNTAADDFGNQHYAGEMMSTLVDEVVRRQSLNADPSEKFLAAVEAIEKVMAK